MLLQQKKTSNKHELIYKINTIILLSINFKKERDSLTVQLEKIEDKAMKSFTTIVDNEADTTDLDLDNVVIKQMNELKKKIGT